MKKIKVVPNWLKCQENWLEISFGFLGRRKFGQKIQTCSKVALLSPSLLSFIFTCQRPMWSVNTDYSFAAEMLSRFREHSNITADLILQPNELGNIWNI